MFNYFYFSFLHTLQLPNQVNIVNDKINLTQAEYNYIFNQVKNQLLANIQELVDNDEIQRSTHHYEFCNMTFISK